MILGFNDDGYLPPGIHSATLEEISARFGQAVHGENLCDGSQLGSEGNGGSYLVSIENRRQLENTRMKLQELEQTYLKRSKCPPGTSTFEN
jgi:hypothetical protein